ncbi:MAG: hypothetical protein ABWX59_05580 [Microbacteriaceae bacterium]
MPRAVADGWLAIAMLGIAASCVYFAVVYSLAAFATAGGILLVASGSLAFCGIRRRPEPSPAAI